MVRSHANLRYLMHVMTEIGDRRIKVIDRYPSKTSVRTRPNDLGCTKWSFEFHFSKWVHQASIGKYQNVKFVFTAKCEEILKEPTRMLKGRFT